MRVERLHDAAHDHRLGAGRQLQRIAGPDHHIGGRAGAGESDGKREPTKATEDTYVPDDYGNDDIPF